MTSLQAILDASDSDDETFTTAIPLTKFSTDTSATGDIDLEQILREDEDEDDNHNANANDNDNDNLAEFSPSQMSAFTASSVGVTATSRSATAALNNLRQNDSNNNGLHPLRADPTDPSLPRQHAQQPYPPSQAYFTTGTATTTSRGAQGAAAHNEEDWAVLQAILREEDEDDEDGLHEMVEDPTAGYLNASDLNTTLNSTSATILMDTSGLQSPAVARSHDVKSPLSASSATNAEVEQLLAQATEEDGDDDDLGELVLRFDQHTNNQNQPPFSLAPKSKEEDALLLPTSSAPQTLFPPNSSSLEATTIRQQPSVHPPQDGAALEESLSMVEQELTDEEASRRALEQAQAYERRLLKAGHRDIVSPLMVKRRLKPKITLAKRVVPELDESNNAEDAEVAAQNKSGSDPRGSAPPASRPSPPTTPRFYTSGLIENKSLPEISSSINKHAALDAKIKCGLPTCLAFNSRFIAVGTQLGIVLLFDLFGALRQRLGAANFDDSSVRMVGSITSLDLNSNGECCAVGYKSGLIVLWDTIRGTVLRSVDDLHPSPILSVRFYSDLKLVSADAGGLVNKASFNKNMLWSTYSMDAECLLDGTAGQILSVDVLPPHSMVHANYRSRSSASLNKTLKAISLIALSSERSSFAVAVEPKVSVLHRWSRPPKERVDALWDNDHAAIAKQQQLQDQEIDSSSSHQQYQHENVYLPCLAWGWVLTSGAGNVALPMLARSWGCCLQLLVSSFPTLDEGSEGLGNGSSNKGSSHHDDPDVHWPAFGLHEEFDAESPIVALQWLSERSLVYLTITNELTVVDTVVMTLLERLDFSDIRVVFAEFALSRSAAAAVVPTDSEKVNEEQQTGVVAPVSCTTFQNSVRCGDQRLMVLCQDELRQVTMISPRQRISSLEADGEWLEALALALDHYEGTFASQEDRKRDPTGKRDLSRHPEFSGVPKGEEEEFIAKLLLRYLALAVDNAPDSSSDDNLMSLGNGRARINLAQSHYQMLAGVCVEYCVTIKRLDLLFGPIFRRFHSVGYVSVFLDVLEPYVLNDRLSYIAPEAMSLFVGHCKANNGISTVERCLLHMDCTILDFDSIVALLRNNDMYSAMFFVFNQGLNDYVSPLQLLLERVFDEADGNAILRRPGERGRKQSDFDKFGYKAILYLRFCFQGKSFPKEEKILPEERQASVKPELLNFLIQAAYTAPDHAARGGGLASSSEKVGHRSYLYPYMRLLVQVDPSLLFETIAEALNERAAYQEQHRNKKSVKYPTEQEVVDLSTALILPELTEIPTEHVALVKSRQATSAFLDFTAKYITRGVVRVKKSLTLMIVKRISAHFTNAPNATLRKAAQSEIMELLSALPRASYEPDKVLDLIENAGIHRAALLLHQQVASSWQGADSDDDLELRAQHFCSAIDCFIDDDDAVFRLEVYDYIRKECTGIHRNSEGGTSGPQNTLSHAVYSRMRRLVRLDALMTARLVAELFVEDLDVVVDALDDNTDGGESQFLFLQAVVSGELLEVDPVAGSVLNPSMEHHLKYLALMAKLHPTNVYDYLSTHDNYRAEDALKLCEEYQIADASAYLLERMGNISSALQLILQTLEGRLMALKRTLRGLEVDLFGHHLSVRSSSGLNLEGGMRLPSKQEQEAEGVRRILVVALDLCERNSGSYNAQTEHGSQLWFNVLDRLINAKGFLRLVNEQKEHAKMMEGVLNDLLRLTMQRMVSNVALLDLVRKVTQDHSGSRLGELREMVMSLLGTYGFELSLFGKAADVFHEDISSMKTERSALVLKAAPAVRTDSHSERKDFTSSDGNVLIDSDGNGMVLERSFQSPSRTSAGGFKDTLQRLRNRRATSEKPIVPVASSVGLTDTDRHYYEGTFEPVVYHHPVGSLGEAHHRGRLISFNK